MALTHWIWRRPTLGIALGANSCRAVLLQHERVIWNGTLCADEDESTEALLQRLLATMPVSKIRRPRAMIAIGPSAAQVKRIAGMPEARDVEVITKVVQANVGRFFLKNGIPLVTAPARAVGCEWWSAAFEEPTLRAAIEACRRRGIAVAGCVPTLAVLGRSFGDGEIVWRDGDVAMLATIANGELVDTRRLAAGELGAYPASAPALVEDLLPVADAYAAARADRRGALVLSEPDVTHVREARTRRRLLLAVAVVLSGIAALVAPGLSAARMERRAEARVAASRTHLTEIASAGRDLREISGALDQVARFTASRRSVVSLLGALSVALPESTAIVTIRVDTTGGSIVALSPAGATVLPALSAMRELEGLQISGAVTKETSTGVSLDRLTLRFRLKRAVDARRPQGSKAR